MKQYLALMVSILMILGLIGCGEDPQPVSPPASNPTTPSNPSDNELADPSGTITVLLPADGSTSIDGLLLDRNLNLSGSDWMICKTSQCRGLAEVSEIPTNGWSEVVHAESGFGYVAYSSSTDRFLRLYVVSIAYHNNDPESYIQGVNIKYQKDFKGKKETVKPEIVNIKFGNQGGQQVVGLENTSIVPFTLNSSAEWCKVEKGSTLEYSFLTDAIIIDVNKNMGGVDQEAIVTIENLYGEKTEILVKRAAHEKYIECSINEISFNFEGETNNNEILLYTNIDPEDIHFAIDEDWIIYDLTNQSKSNSRKNLRWIGNSTITRTLLEEPVYKTLKVYCSPNYNISKRVGHINISYENLNQTLVVSQDGVAFNLSSTNITLGANDDLAIELQWSGDVKYQNLAVSDLPDWLECHFKDGTVTFIAEPNSSETSRSAYVKIIFDGLNGNTPVELQSVQIKQKGMVYSNESVHFDSNATQYSLLYPLPAGTQLFSSVDWCDARISGSNIIINVTGTTVDRNAVISFSGIKAKIYVSQSKYAVGDIYDENGVYGTVYYMKDGVGKIARDLYTKKSWSLVNIDVTGANSLINGEDNTKYIQTLPNWESDYPLFACVESLNTNGQTGWYVPAKLEYTSPYGTLYWSSTNYADYSAYFATDKTNGMAFTNKRTAYNVLAMKKFYY